MKMRSVCPACKSFFSPQPRSAGWVLLLVAKLLAVLNVLAYALGFALPAIGDRVNNTAVRCSPYAGLAGLVRAQYRVVRTDRDRPVLVRYFAELEPPTEAMVEAEEAWLRSQGFHSLVRTGEPGPHSNCYGWVFTGGRYAVDGNIEDILHDNGYCQTTHPQANDLAVYRDPSGQIVHVGIVRKADNGEPLVESKWGARGRYHHAASTYCATSTCQFYHSKRRGHLLVGIFEDSDSPKTAAILTPPHEW
jgi:hypothetical protein